MSDEENCIRVIASALQQASQRINGTADAPATAGVPQVTTKEAAEFVDMITSISASVESDVERLRKILFDVSPNLIPVVVSFLQTPQLATPGDDLSELFMSVLRCLSRIVCGCCCDQVKDQPAAAAYLSSLASDILHKHNTVHLIVGMLTPMSSPEVQFAAAETLFALLMRSSQAKDDLAASKSLSTLLAPLSEASSNALRAYIAACLRELSNSHAAKVASDAVIDLLTRLLALDDAPDVRALAAETMDVLFKSEPVAWERCERKKELATCLVNKLDRENAFEVVEASLKLIETLVVADASLPIRAESTFTDYFLVSYGDRSLINAMAAGNRVASLCARCLRLVAQMAPFYRHVGFNVFQHLPSLSKVLTTMVDLANAPNDKNEVLQQILRVELSIAFSLMLASDPRCRQLLSSHLHEDHEWMQKVRAAALSNLNSAAIEYYGGINIIDVTATLVNDIHDVEWEIGMRPTRASIQGVFDKQDRRWEERNWDEVPSNVPDLRHVKQEGDDADARAMRLTFILLSFSCHVTLTPAATQPPPQPSNHQSTFTSGAEPSPINAQNRLPSMSGVRFTSDERQASPRREIETEYGPIGGTNGQPTTPGRKGPFPTRTSMLREWRAHPEKFAAIQKAAHNPEMLDAPRPGSYFVDPSQQSQSSFRTNRRAASPRRVAIFTKFDAALKLCTQFSQCYNNVGDAHAVVYETSGDGFARRQGSRNAYFATAHAMRTKSWTIQTLKEGDLFFFSVPFVALNSFAIEQVRTRAVRHLGRIKKSFVITPQAAKARRWFLYDMVNHVMPGVINAFSDLLDLFAQHGDENVKFPIVMFREKDMALEGEQAALHSGNLLEVLDQVRFYFEKTSEQRKQQGLGGVNVSSQYLRDLEGKISALNNMKFTGEEAHFVPDGFQPDGRHGVGHDVDLDSDKDSDEVSIAEPTGMYGAARHRDFADDVSDVSSIE